MAHEKKVQKLMNAYPGIVDLERKARKRLPKVTWQYLHSGTGRETAVKRNRQAFDKITITPRFMQGKSTQDLTTPLFGKSYNAPFGVAPVGLSDLIWPKAELMLAQMAKRKGIPYCLSQVGNQTPETIGPIVGDAGWFQLYPPHNKETLKDILQRAKDANFGTLILTVDVPVLSRREQAKKAGMTTPFSITPNLLWQFLTHPAWLRELIHNGPPRLRTIEPYSDGKDLGSVAESAAKQYGGDINWDYVKTVRDLWQGPLVLKGLLHPGDAAQAISLGVDGIGVSNHGGRQFDAAPATIDLLPAIVQEVDGKAAIIFDSGITSGLDIVRALALGADFVLMGRAFLYGVAALGAAGADHAAEILLDELRNNMAQLGSMTIEEVKNLTRHG